MKRLLTCVVLGLALLAGAAADGHTAGFGHRGGDGQAPDDGCLQRGRWVMVSWCDTFGEACKTADKWQARGWRTKVILNERWYYVFVAK